MQVLLAHETDWPGFRQQARALLARQVEPSAVDWATAGALAPQLRAQQETTPAPAAPALAPAAPPTTVPSAFLRLCETVVLHRDAQRFTLLYRLLWRFAREPALRHDPLDADLLLARTMAQAVRRDMHKMKAFVRFRQVDDGDAMGQPLHVAWFEPEHHIVEAIAPWFQRRFTNMRWALLTPLRCVRWDGGALQIGPPAQRADAPPPDAGEQLWLTYYQGIFNPARLKLKAMHKEMPRKYWHNLPEAALIAPLAARSAERSGRMVEQPASVPARRIVPIAAPAQASPAPGSLAALGSAAQVCRACPIGELATQAVMGEGPLRPRLMFVGEQPGDQEDIAGRPFVGPAGQLFDRALARTGMPRREVFVTNAVRHFKFELRGRHRIHKTPAQREAQACQHWLDEEILLVRPRALVALGATAARALLDRGVAVLSERGQWFLRGDGRPVLVTLHPSALLRMPPGAQVQAFEDFVRDLALAAQGPPEDADG
jgi:DNA polymerase